MQGFDRSSAMPRMGLVWRMVRIMKYDMVREVSFLDGSCTSAY